MPIPAEGHGHHQTVSHKRDPDIARGQAGHVAEELHGLIALLERSIDCCQHDPSLLKTSHSFPQCTRRDRRHRTTSKAVAQVIEEEMARGWLGQRKRHRREGQHVGEGNAT